MNELFKNLKLVTDFEDGFTVLARINTASRPDDDDEDDDCIYDPKLTLG